MLRRGGRTSHGGGQDGELGPVLAVLSAGPIGRVVTPTTERGPLAQGVGFQ